MKTVGKRIVSILLAVILLLGAVPLAGVEFKATALESTGNSTFDAFINDSRFTHGAAYGNRTPYLVAIQFYGCAAYCADFVKYCFNKNNPKSGEYFTGATNIRAGDVIIVGNGSDGSGHWFVCLKRSGNNLYVAEGNYGSGYVRIGWNYSIVNDSTISGSNLPFTNGWHYLASHTCDYRASATIAKAPTKTATGTRVRTCSCGKTINETIPAIPYTTGIPEGIYTITSKCLNGLQVATNAESNFNVFVAGGDYPDQYWLFHKNNDGTYTIENARYNGKVLDVEDLSMVNNGNIIAFDYNGGDNQKFYVIPEGSYYRLVSKSSYLTMDNYNAETTPGNNIIQYTDNGNDNQRWALKLSNPPLSLSSSSVNVSAGSSKTVNCTVGRETRGVTSSCSIADTSVCSASWGSWNGMTCPLTITGKAGGTTTVKVTLKDKDTGIVYDTKTITVTVPGAAFYTLTYNANGGTGAPASQTGNGNVTLSNTKPTRSGYTFKGWATSAGATTAQYSAGASYNLTGNATLYAVWQKNATPAQATVKAVSISDFTINYRFSTTLKPQITADEGAKYSVKYESSDPNVASVDNNGRVTGEKRGAAVITCTVTDEYGNEAKDTCAVSVDYTVWQWIIIILLFGWLWYI